MHSTSIGGRAGARPAPAGPRQLRPAAAAAGALAILALQAGPVSALELRGTVSGRQVVRAADSPLLVPATVTVPKGASLSIEAGVKVRLGEGASLVVLGELHALGERRAPVRFEPLVAGTRWGNIKILGDKDLPCYDGDRRYIEDSGGSRLLGCELVGGGRVPDDQYDGGALYLNGSAPIVRDCLFQDNQADRGGALVAYNFATPLVESCTFERNQSLLDDGGALHCFFYSDAVITRNFFVENRSARHAGALYISVSNPLVQENAFIDNSAEGFGGAVYASSSAPRLIENALFAGTGEDRSTGLVFQADCRPEVTGNSLMSGGVEVYGLNLGGDLNLSGNWWGSTDEFLIRGKIQQGGRGQERTMDPAPWRDRPVPNLLTQPVEIHSLHAMADGEWQDTLAFDLCDQALVRFQIRAVDRNKYAVDQTGMELRILERPQETLTVYLAETEKASGVFRARVALNRDEDDTPRFDARVGEHVLASSAANPDIRRLYRVDEARPVVHGLTLLSDPDPTHAIQAALRLGWEYFSLLGQPQTSWQLQVASDSSFARADMWDSGAQPLAGGRQLTYAGQPLRDGERYFLRLRGQGGGAWSDWKRFVVRTDGPLNTLRMNSLPPVPDLLAPAPEAVIAQTRPTLGVRAVQDREGDPVGYEFQLARDEFFQDVLAASDPGQREATWAVGADLADNGAFWWRLRVHDGFEEGEWSAPRRFYVNSVEQAPAPFDLEGPAGAIADLMPEFSWQAAHDPDPLAGVRYTLVAGGQESLQGAQRVTGLDVLRHRLKEKLANRQPLWWAVEAVDNSGRVTRSARVLRLDPDTTPSPPQPQSPANGEDAAAGQRLRFAPAVDPWPADRLSYELQVAGPAGDFARPLIAMKGLGQEELAALSLDGLPESRLLAEDAACSWRLRAVDEHGAASEWSAPATCWLNRANNPPAKPAPGEPAEGALCRQPPAFTWTQGVDPDHSDPPAGLSTVIQLSQDADFKGRLVEERVTGAAGLALGAQLEDNSRWHWRLQAVDDGGAASGWSAPRSFVLNRADEPPGGLALTAPAEGARLFRLDQVELAWEPARDPDWDARLSYAWQVSAAAEPGRVLAQGRTTETRALAKGAFTSGSDLLVQVTVTDETGLSQVLPPRRVTVDSHPVAPLPRPGPEELGPADVLAWQAATDPDPDDRLSYRVAIRDGKGQVLATGTTSALQTSPGRLPGAAQFPEDGELAWTVTAVDPHGLEAESAPVRFWFNRANDAPGAPAFAPELAGAPVLRTERPALPFTPGQDRDHGDPPATLWHELQVAAAPGFAGAATHRVPPGATTVQDVALGDNAVWHLRLRCLDDGGAAGPWCAPVVVTVNLREDPPAAPELRTPAPGQRLFDLGGLDLAWSPAADPDPGARVRYRVTVQDAAGRELARRETEETRLRLALAIPNASELRLAVTAVDETGLETSSQPLRVAVDSTPGGTSISGREGQVLGAADQLSWTEATDPDPADRLRYEVAWSTSRAFTDGAARTVAASRLPLSQWPELPENAELWFRVRAVDGHDLAGPWSEPWGAVRDAVNEAPLALGELSPGSGTRPAGAAALAWPAPRDPDRRAQHLEVEVQAAAAASFAQPLWTRRAPAAGPLSLDLAPGQLWLRARAVDQDGAAGPWSPAVAWSVDAPPPPAP